MSETMRYLLMIIGTTILGCFIAMTFYTPAGDGYIALPGVVIAIISAFLCGVAFFSCPIKPLVGKGLALVLAVPSVWFAVFCIRDFANR